MCAAVRYQVWPHSSTTLHDLTQCSIGTGKIVYMEFVHISHVEYEYTYLPVLHLMLDGMLLFAISPPRLWQYRLRMTMTMPDVFTLLDRCYAFAGFPFRITYCLFTISETGWHFFLFDLFPLSSVTDLVPLFYDFPRTYSFIASHHEVIKIRLLHIQWGCSGATNA